LALLKNTGTWLAALEVIGAVARALMVVGEDDHGSVRREREAGG
jgi:hypothetical protein